MESGQEEIIIYTDGGCHGNPGVGAWASVILSPTQKEIQISGYESYTTNNKMELLAVINSLKKLISLKLEKLPITLYTDSQYVKNGITIWITNWKKNNWLNSAKQPVKNQELWLELDELVSNLNINFCWVRGHSGNKYNEICDSLVQAAIKKGEALK